MEGDMGAFVCATGIAVRKVELGVCRRVRRRCVGVRWRCTLGNGNGREEEGGGKVGEDGGVSVDGIVSTGEVDGVVSMGGEGIVTLGGDKGLEEAFAKSLDGLERFSRRQDLSERESEMSVKVEKVGEDVVEKGDEGREKGEGESDDAVVAIEEAKGGKKKKKGGRKKKVVEEEEKKEEEEWDLTPRWFFLQVKPGCEQSCAISIRNMAQALELDIMEVLVPTTKIMRLTKSGKSVKKEERMFPGYILVLMVMNHRNYGDVQRVPNVQWFMGDPNRDKSKKQPFRPPLPVSDAEMKMVFDKIRDAESDKPEMKTAIRPGDSIQVVSGGFEGERGRVVAVKPDLNIIVAKLLMFGRESSVELEIEQVQVVQDVVDEEEDDDDNDEGESKVVKEGVSADVASGDDDLELLLQDDDGGKDGLFEFEELGKGLDKDKKKRVKERDVESLEDENGPDLSFLDDLDDEGVEEEESLMKHEDLNALLGGKEELEKDEDDLFAFLDDDDFEEASVEDDGVEDKKKS